MTHDGPSLLLEVFLVQLASYLELFMSFLSSRLHPFCLILLLCLLFAIWSLTFCWTFCLTHSLFYASDLDFSSINDLLLVRAFGSIDLFVHFLWVSSLIVDHVLWHSSSSLFHGVLPSMFNKLCLLCAMLLEFIMCLTPSLIWIHLVTHPNWIESFLQGFVQQNI